MPLQLEQQQHRAAGSSSTPPSCSTALLVLWLPAGAQRHAVIQEHMTDQDREVDGSYMQPANNRVLYVGWASLQKLKRVMTCASLLS